MMSTQPASLAPKLGTPPVDPEPNHPSTELDERKLAERVKELTTPSVLRPALIDPAEVVTARQKFKTAAGTLQALEAMASIRIVWLNQREGLTPDISLSAPQKESAARFFSTHPDQPEAAPRAGVPMPVNPPSAVTHAGQNGGPGKVADVTFALANLLVAQSRLLARISDTLDQIAANTAPAAPNYRRPYADFKNFDWTSVGAVITARDGDGVSAVEWNGYDFTRRAGVGKYGKAIWFSRPTGKDADGNNTYARLITFKDATEAEPLPKK